MNARTFLSADGRLRRAFTVKDVERMVEVGLIDPDERLEIVAGEIMPVSPRGARHEILKRAVVKALIKALPDGIGVVPEAGWRLGEMFYLEPDVLVYPETIPFEAVKGSDTLLVVEFADATLGYDLGRKAALYAVEGVREYWVIDAATRETYVHRSPGPDGFADVTVHPATADLRPAFLPEVSIRLADLPTV